MGCFNVACAISKISIGCYEPVVYIPLEMSKMYNTNLDNGEHLLIYPWHFYRPLTLPIIGKYNDYGDVEDVEKNDNTKIIEEHFNMKIEDFVDGDKQPKAVNAGMFIHKEIYELFTSRTFPIGYNDDVRNVLSDQYDKMKYNIGIMEKKYDNFVKAYRSNLEKTDEEEYERIIEELKESRQYGNPFHYVVWTLNYIASTDKAGFDFRQMYTPAIEKGLLKKEFIDSKVLEYNMVGTNSHYGPTANGEQCGNDYASRALYKKALEIVEEKIKELE